VNFTLHHTKKLLENTPADNLLEKAVEKLKIFRACKKNNFFAVANQRFANVKNHRFLTG
jgi:hypothetical protein